MPIYVVRYHLRFDDGESSPMQVVRIIADTPEAASEQIIQLEHRRPHHRRIRSVDVRMVALIEDAEAREDESR